MRHVIVTVEVGTYSNGGGGYLKRDNVGELGHIAQLESQGLPVRGAEGRVSFFFSSSSFSSCSSSPHDPQFPSS